MSVKISLFINCNSNVNILEKKRCKFATNDFDAVTFDKFQSFSEFLQQQHSRWALRSPWSRDHFNCVEPLKRTTKLKSTNQIKLTKINSIKR